ncbi:MAG: DUF4115 domain-containing protein [Candidatus Omnitrophica bacterium]|nr:DUF4115 domain-containing protein [Candidatus Omnitrophota bacterium]
MKSPKEIGEILKEARQKKGLSFDKIYKATRMQSSIIRAFEEGRAEEILDRVYVLLFLKKYASLLDLNADSLARDYKSSLTERKTEALDVIGEKEPVVKDVEIQKWVTLVGSLVLVLMVVFFILFVGLKLKSFYRTRISTTAKAVETVKSVKTTKPLKKSPKKEAVKQSEDKIVFPVIPKNRRIKLVLHGTEDVWMKVSKDGRVDFVGTLRKNATKKWIAKKSIELWVGRAEALRFTINGVSFGKIGEGNIKAIQISKDGLKMRNKWLFKAKR